MLTWANHAQAKEWLHKTLGINVGVCTEDVPGHIQFAMFAQYMVLAAQKMKELYPDTYEFNRTPHYIEDTVWIDTHRRVTLRLNFGSQRCLVSLYDSTQDVQLEKE